MLPLWPCLHAIHTFAMKAMGRTVSAAPNCSVHISRVDRLCTEETTKRACRFRTSLSLLVANILKLLDRIAAILFEVQHVVHTKICY